MASKRRALISVSDKTGIEDFAKGLTDRGFEIISTGGTMRALTKAGIPVRAVSDYTGVPEILGGRVKTLHPSIFGGILAQRHLSEDMQVLEEHGMSEIHIVVVNLYPFEQTVQKGNATDPEIIEQIDIGGPSLLRAAAKNHQDVYPVVDPADYPAVLDSLNEGREGNGLKLRRRLSAKVFDHCSRYDRAIARYLSESEDSQGAEASPLPEVLGLGWPQTQSLRYGENPQQAAAFYANPKESAPSLAHCKQLQGKELSYNNFLDADAALEMPREFDEPACVILKHANPCGVGVGTSILEAYERALAGDPVSAFGGIVGINRPLAEAAAAKMKELFLEVIIAPEFSPEALAILSKKKNLRLLECGPLSPRKQGIALRSISGGILAQETDWKPANRESMKVVSKAQPTDDDWKGLLFGWKVVRWVRSNAIVYAAKDRTLGVGAGQMSRIDAARFGIDKAGGDVAGGYLASDAFFPFRDVVDLAAEAKIRAIIQPGGSVRDEESIAAADEHGIVMVFTGERHFRH